MCAGRGSVGLEALLEEGGPCRGGLGGDGCGAQGSLPLGRRGGGWRAAAC